MEHPEKILMDFILNSSGGGSKDDKQFIHSLKLKHQHELCQKNNQKVIYLPDNFKSP